MKLEVLVYELYSFDDKIIDFMFTNENVTKLQKINTIYICLSELTKAIYHLIWSGLEGVIKKDTVISTFTEIKVSSLEHIFDVVLKFTVF